VLGPDIIDPRQMEQIRFQAELAAKGEKFGVRELPPAVIDTVIAKRAAKASRPAAAVGAGAAAVAEVTDEALVAARLARRQEAVARKRAQLAKG
jgi:hypothetical protein